MRPPPSPAPLEHTIRARAHDVAGLPVRRALPVRERRMVGPFIFLDEMGPAALAPGNGVDVPPHPHIGLATVTYLFEGALLHRDSLGSEQRIVPGDVNWMTAGRGIAHSERSPDDERAAASRLHGLQCWVALPREHEEDAPSFAHHAAATLPAFERGDARLWLVAGRAFGHASPVETRSPLAYAVARLPAGGVLPLDPARDATPTERAVYVVEGTARVGGATLEPGTLAVLAPGAALRVAAGGDRDALVALLGGEPFPEPRFIDWNFVASSRERIEAAKRAWVDDRFERVPGEVERVPLPGARS